MRNVRPILLKIAGIFVEMLSFSKVYLALLEFPKQGTGSDLPNYSSASGTTILNATTSIPACLSAPFHMLCLCHVVRAHRQRGCNSNDARAVSWMYSSRSKPAASVMTTQSRYETLLCSEDDSTSPTKWRMQGHKDFQSHLIFFKSN